MKKRRPGDSMGEEYSPSSVTAPYRVSRFSRGIRTSSKAKRPLSTPGRPPFFPSSSIVMPGSGSPASSRIGT